MKTQCLIDKYIDSEKANPNYLNLVATSKDEACIKLDPETRLKAKRHYKKWMEKNISKGSGIMIGAEIVFAYIDEDVQYDSTGDIPRYIYNKRWIEDNLEYPTIMQNFITLFEFADSQFRLLPVSYAAEMSAIEKVMGVKGKNDYPFGVGFMFKSCLSSLQVAAYQRELQSLGIEIEEVYAWFFSKYLDEEFGIKGYSFQPPTKDSSYREKTRDLLAELDSVLKQYDLVTKHGEIDRELLEITSNSPGFSSHKSGCDEKYGYAKSEELLAIINMLFSDQSPLSYNKRTEDDYLNTVIIFKKEISYA